MDDTPKEVMKDTAKKMAAERADRVKLERMLKSGPYDASVVGPLTYGSSTAGPYTFYPSTSASTVVLTPPSATVTTTGALGIPSARHSAYDYLLDDLQKRPGKNIFVRTEEWLDFLGEVPPSILEIQQNVEGGMTEIKELAPNVVQFGTDPTPVELWAADGTFHPPCSKCGCSFRKTEAFLPKCARCGAPVNHGG